MACQDYQTLFDFWANGQFIDGLLCPYQAQLGGLTFGLMIYAGIGIALYIYSGSVVLPLAVGIILASIVAVVVPAAALQVVVIVIVFGIALAGTGFVKRRLQAA